MRALLALLTVLLAVVAAPAQASHPRHGPPPPPAGVEVRNDSGHDVDVFVDGAHRGEVRAGETRILSTHPGHRQVQARSRFDGLVLHDVRMALEPGRPAWLHLVPPSTRLTLRNHGEAPLYVTMTGTAEAFWLLPGQRQAVDLPSGRSIVSTSLYTHDGLVPLAHHDVTLPPGQRVSRDIGWTAPPPATWVTLTNHESQTVRVYVSGREVAVVPPRSTREFQVAAGSHMVTVTREHGPLLYNAPVTFDARGRYRLEVRGGLRVLGGGRTYM